jgi:hypothetical protein
VKRIIFAITLVLALVLVTVAVDAWNPIPVTQDPHLRMPGTQPNQVALEGPNRCMNCHAGYNTSVEPGHNWLGSMMAQSSRDFLFWSAMTVAAQDSIFALNNPNATDLCLRCHFPKGWLEGRSDPTNASLMFGDDYDGVQCDFCHRMVDPFYEDTYAGNREGSDWLNYWDETNNSGTPSQAAADATYQEDAAIMQSIVLFNGTPFFQNNQPFSGTYDESGSGQYFISPNADKRASFADADARHQMLYSRFHKSRYFCNACHDVSNPVLANLGQDGTLPLTSETESAYSYFHVERTFSEFMLSAYGANGGAAGIGPYAPNVYETSLANNYIARCQDCHMRDVVGTGANKRGVPVRPDESVEHPESGQPLHDLTGGNMWVPWVLASSVPGSPNYDAFNDNQLNQGPAALTLDLTAGQGLNPQALLDGVARAQQQLELAATIDNLTYDGNTGVLSFRIQNQTGHKLISGFPEGRRIFINIRAYTGGNLIYEVNPYDGAAGTLKGLSYGYQDGFGLPSPGTMGVNEQYVDELVYEMHPSSTLTGEPESFHFVLADDRYKDNRIPPQGFDITAAAARHAQPRWHGADALDYFTAAEYAGGYDDVSLAIPAGADTVEVTLYYQTTSREYMEFLRDEINGNLDNLTLPGGAYVIQSDPFFDGLRAWGNTIWDLWRHNKDQPGAAPVMMTTATFGGGGGGGCMAPVPTILSAEVGNKEVLVTWSDEQSADSMVTGYLLYYDQADKLQLVTDAGLSTSYLDTLLTNGQEYCYRVSSYYDATCESATSPPVCATPQPAGQAGVTLVETGIYQGKGGNRTFVLADTFAPGDEVVVRVHVIDGATGLPLAGATVDLTIDGPELVSLITGQTDNQGMAEATWKTSAPKGNNPGTPTGAYTATTAGLTRDGYTWDGVPTAHGFVLQ